MKLQNIIYPSTKNCIEEALYFRRAGEVQYSLADEYITLNEEAAVFFDTYFNGFSAGKWYKYTKINQVKLCLKIKGYVRISLWYKEKQATQICSKIVKEFYYDTKGEIEEITCEFETESTQGMYSFNVFALEDEVEFHGGYYYTDILEEQQETVRLATIICTFKREKYVYKNMKMLCESFLENKESELYHDLEIIISDNAKSLDKSQFSNAKIHVFENKNVGGSGGFTRGLIEAMQFSKKRPFTHVLLMDDDVVIQPESIYRTHQLLKILKPQYKDTYVGGAMLRTDLQWFQTEAGGLWNCGQLVGHKNGLDLRNLDACLYNEFEEKCDFNAWWYCTVPMKFITEENLPLPIFIRGDDVEYGIRNMKHLILLNGICVWHEPFEFKYSSSMYYYIFRNRLIDNAVRGLSYSAKNFIRDFKSQYIREIFLLRYKNARLLLQGANDFLNGIDWLKEQDGEVLNRQVMENGYKLQYIDELPIPFDYPTYEQTLRFHDSRKQQWKRRFTLNGFFGKAERTVIAPVNGTCVAHFYRVGKALNYDLSSQKGFVTYRSRKEIVQLVIEYIKLTKRINKNYKKVVREYEKRKEEIMNLQFWKEYLEIK